VSDCFPVGRENLPIPTKISFARDLWSAKSGAATFAQVVKMQGGRRGSGRTGAGRGNNRSNPAPSGAMSGDKVPQQGHQAAVPSIKPFVSNMMQQMGGAPPGMFPMMNPALWNLPMGQWQQFMSQMNPMGNFPQGQFNQEGQGASVSQSSGVGLPASTQAQQAPAAKSKKKVQSANSDGSKKNDKAMVPSSGPMLDQKFKDVVCFDCGEPGHYVGLCTRAKRCFICGRPGHHMDNCAAWYAPMPTAKCWGSANQGLGFFHIDVEGPAAVQWLNMDNVGIVVVNEGEISEKELEQNFNEMWKVN
jgi:hypothetical protein